jgi:hypothetical protein
MSRAGKDDFRRFPRALPPEETVPAPKADEFLPPDRPVVQTGLVEGDGAPGLEPPPGADPWVARQKQRGLRIGQGCRSLRPTPPSWLALMPGRSATTFENAAGDSAVQNTMHLDSRDAPRDDGDRG